MRELLVGKTVGGDPFDGFEERVLGEVGGGAPHRREQLTHELRETLRPGLGHGIGRVSDALHRAIGAKRQREGHGRVFYRTRLREKGHGVVAGIASTPLRASSGHTSPRPMRPGLAVPCFAAATLAAAVGCEPTPSRSAVHDSAPGAPSPAVAAPAVRIPVAGALSIFAAPVDTLSTLADWLAAHAGDVVSDRAPEGADPDLTCRVASSRTTLGGRTMVRSALFNIPNPPAGEGLPTDTVRVAEQHCHLRALWLEATVPDSLQARVFADSLSAMFDAALGPSRAGVAMDGPGTGQWRGGRTWSGPGTTIGLGIVPADTIRDDDGTVVRAVPAKVVLASFAPHSGIDALHGKLDFIDLDDEKEGERDLELDRADSALGWAAVPRLTAALRPALAVLRAHAQFDTLHPAAIDSGVLRGAAFVHDTAPQLGPRRRAAALLATDIVVNGFFTTIEADSAHARERAARSAIGLTYDEDPLDGGYRFLRPGLWEAYRLDPGGPAGRAAFVTLLGEGWTTKSRCSDGADEYRRVIDQGEAALARGASDAPIHYYVGIAHHDIVSLARGGMYDDYSHPSDFAPLAPAARVRAIEHLRAYLAQPGDRRMRRHAWRMAMTLMLGRTMDARYFCVYD